MCPHLIQTDAAGQGEHLGRIVNPSRPNRDRREDLVCQGEVREIAVQMPRRWGKISGRNRLIAE